MMSEEKERIYSRVTQSVFALIDRFAKLAGLTRSEAIAVLVVVGLRYALGQPIESWDR